MKHKIEIDREHLLIRHKNDGVIELNEIKETWEEIIKLREFKESDYRLLSDYRKGHFNFTMADVEEIFYIIRCHRELFEGRLKVLLIDNPKNTVISVLSARFAYKEFGFKMVQFYTEEAALRFLNIHD